MRGGSAGGGEEARGVQGVLGLVVENGRQGGRGGGREGGVGADGRQGKGGGGCREGMAEKVGRENRS